MSNSVYPLQERTVFPADQWQGWLAAASLGKHTFPTASRSSAPGTNYTFRKVGRAIKRRPVKQQNKRLFSTYVGIGRRFVCLAPPRRDALPSASRDVRPCLRRRELWPEPGPGRTAVRPYMGIPTHVENTKKRFAFSSAFAPNERRAAQPLGSGRPNASAASWTICSPMARDEVAPGDGAFRTWTASRPRMMLKSSQQTAVAVDGLGADARSSGGQVILPNIRQQPLQVPQENALAV